jgi:hypothetical protein
MMSGVQLETFWAFNKLLNNKFYYKLHLVGISTETYYDARIHEYQIFWTYKCRLCLIFFSERQKHLKVFLISNFCRVLNVLCFLLGNSLASEFYMPTFPNTLFHLHRQVGVEWPCWRNVGVFIRKKVWLENSLSQIFSRMKTPKLLQPSHSTPTCLWRWNSVFRNVGIYNSDAAELSSSISIWRWNRQSVSETSE